MAVDTVFTTPHEKRARMVAEALTKNSSITDEAATALAEHVLDALDHIPEKIR